jgi:formylmethanofuran dehydrogenase subunit B
VLALVQAAKHVQVVGWHHLDITDQQALLDWTAAWRGSIDRSAVDDRNSVGVALTQVGKVTATLGQIRDGADTIVVWGQHGLPRYPRLRETLSGNSPQWFDIDLPAGEGIEVLQWLRMVVQAWSHLRQLPADLDAAMLQSPGVEQIGRQRASLWLERLLQIARSTYVTWLYSPDEKARSVESNLEATACLQLVRQLNDLTRCVCLTLTADHNSLGAENVAAWTTGFTGRINWNESPRSGESFAARQQGLSGAVDLWVAIVGHPADTIWPLVEGQKFNRVPTILLYTCDHPLVTQVDVAIPIGQVGWDHTGDVCRLDDWLITRPALQPSQRSRLANWLAQWGCSRD